MKISNEFLYSVFSTDSKKYFKHFIKQIDILKLFYIQLLIIEVGEGVSGILLEQMN